MKTGEKITVKLGIDLLESEIIEVKKIQGKELFRIEASPSKFFSQKDIIYEKEKNAQFAHIAKNKKRYDII